MFLLSGWYYLRQQAYGGWFAASGDPLTILPGLAVVFLAIAVPFLMIGSGKYKLPRLNPRNVLLLAAVSVLATVTSGWVWTGGTVTPAALWWDNYGFPLAWRVSVNRGCPPWCNQPSTTTSFSPLFFAVDLSFYASIMCSLLLAGKQISRGFVGSLGLSSVLHRFLTKHGQFRKKMLTIALVAIMVLTGIESALIWATATPSPPTCYAGCNGFVELSLESYWASSPTNATFKIRNLGSAPTTLISYEVKEFNGNMFSSTGWSGPTIPSGSSMPVNILIDGNEVTFHWAGAPYTVRIVTSQGNWTFYPLLGPNMIFSSLNTPTNITLNISDTGPQWLNLTAYQVQDPMGNAYDSTNWAGPEVGPGTVLPANIVIDGKAFTFQTGTTYTIHLFDSTGTEWTIYAYL